MARRVRDRRLDREPELAAFVRERLYEGWTPEQISGWLAVGNESLPSISFETIYDWVFAKSQKAEGLHRLLPTRRANRGRRKARKARRAIAERRSIHDRPAEVNERAQAGHWEGDLMICKRTRPALVLKERKSRFVIAAKLNGKTPAETARAIMDVFRQLDPSLRKSVTFDNGTEFAKHGLIRDACASWQKGAVENANGRLRRDLPRKCLGFKTPAQALLHELGTSVKTHIQIKRRTSRLNLPYRTAALAFALGYALGYAIS
jgi:IS30 family transposase